MIGTVGIVHIEGNVQLGGGVTNELFMYLNVFVFTEDCEGMLSFVLYGVVCF